MSSATAAVLDWLTRARRVLVIMHATPDGDSAGSALALGMALRRAGQAVDWVARDAVPERLTFLPHAREVLAWPEVSWREYDLFVAVDCGGPSRLAAPDEWWEAGAPLVNIDHHRANNGFGTVNWVEASASSTGEMIVHLFQEAGWKATDEEALCLFTAISTDTLSFRQVNTTLTTLRAVEWLIEQSGLDIGRANRLIWDSRPAGELKFVGWALSSVELSANGRFAWIGVTRRVMEEFGVDDAGVDTVVHHLLSIDGVEVAFLAKEASVPGQVKVSWRGKPPWDVSQLAQEFGGGGHSYAAAAQVTASLQQALARVKQALGSAVRG